MPLFINMYYVDYLCVLYSKRRKKFYGNRENLCIREFSSCSIPFLNLPAIVIYIMYVCLVILCNWFAVNLSKQGYSALDGYLKLSLSKIKS